MLASATIGILRRAAVALLLVAAILAAGSQPAFAASTCNGSSKLCSRTFNQVVLPGSHNAMSNKEDKWGIPNQGINIGNQLKKGIRAMLIDTYYGVPGTINFLGKILPVVNPATESTPGRLTYLCHQSCLSGATPLADGLKVVADFLKSHPREVMAFVNESYITPTDFAAAVTASGLSKYVYTGSTTNWPKLSTMISTNKRVVMFTEGSAGSVTWYHPAYEGIVQETPYSFKTPDLLTDPTKLAASCAANRGGTNGSIFLMNHFVTPQLGPTYAADLVSTAGAVNGKTTIVARARACQSARGKLPNIIAVDQVQLGDVVGAAKTLNGV